MRTIQTRMVLSALASLGIVSCGGGSSPAIPPSQRGSEASLASRAASAAPADTAFIEVRRFERRGSANAKGGCQWNTAAEAPLTISNGGTLETRTLSFDAKACTQLVAVGYRKVPLPNDTTGYEERSRSSTAEIRPIHAAKPKSP